MDEFDYEEPEDEDVLDIDPVAIAIFTYFRTDDPEQLDMIRPREAWRRKGKQDRAVYRDAAYAALSAATTAGLVEPRD